MQNPLRQTSRSVTSPKGRGKYNERLPKGSFFNSQFTIDYTVRRAIFRSVGASPTKGYVIFCVAGIEVKVSFKILRYAQNDKPSLIMSS